MQLKGNLGTEGTSLIRNVKSVNESGKAQLVKSNPAGNPSRNSGNLCIPVIGFEVDSSVFVFTASCGRSLVNLNTMSSLPELTMVKYVEAINMLASNSVDSLSEAVLNFLICPTASDIQTEISQIATDNR